MTPFGPASTFLDMRLPAQSLDRDQLHQLLDFARQRPETVDHLRRETLNFFIRSAAPRVGGRG